MLKVIPIASKALFIAQYLSGFFSLPVFVRHLFSAAYSVSYKFQIYPTLSSFLSANVLRVKQ